MEIKINKQKILKNAGFELTDPRDYIRYMRQLVENLESHNKNYTKKQYFEITQLKEILENIEILK
jgi:hypothetical protein